MQNIDLHHLNQFSRTATNSAAKDVLNICLRFHPAIQHCLDYESTANHVRPTPKQLQRVIHFFASATNPHPKTVFEFRDSIDLHTLAITLRDAMLSVANGLMCADNPISLKKRKNVVHNVFKNMADTPSWEPKKGFFAPTRGIGQDELKKMVKDFTHAALTEIYVPPRAPKYVDPDAVRAHRAATREKKRQAELKNMENDIRKNFGV